MAALLALAAAGTFGVADFLGGQATRRSPVLAVTLLTNLAGGLLAALLVVVIGGEWSIGAIGWSAVGGLSGVAGLVLLYQGLADGPNRLVSPLSAVVAAVVPVTVGIVLGDRPDTLAIVGLGLTPVAVWLVAGGDVHVGSAARRSVLLAVGAGLGFGFFFALLAQVPDGSGAVPLLIARTASVSVLAVAVARKRSSVLSFRASALPLVAGSLDMTANGLFLWSTREGDLAIVGALVSLFPATTVLLAVVLLGERLDRSQIGGLALALAVAALLG